MTKEEAIKLVPSRFRIACEDYTVKITEKGDDFGTFDTIRNEIELFLNVKDDDGIYVEVSKQKFTATWYHELGHCLNYFWNTDVGEDFAQAFSTFMVEFNETKV